MAAGVGVFALTRGGSSSQPTLNGASFSTAYPAGWTLARSDPYPGVGQYAITSTNSNVNRLGIPAPGTVGITVSEFPVATFASLSDPDAATQDPVVLLPHVVGVPRAAAGVRVLTSLHAASLGGMRAAAIVYGYTYRGVGNVQADIVARHGGTIVYIETDTEPSQASRGDAAMAQVVAGWRWR